MYHNIYFARKPDQINLNSPLIDSKDLVFVLSFQVVFSKKLLPIDEHNIHNYIRDSEYGIAFETLAIQEDKKWVNTFYILGVEWQK